MILATVSVVKWKEFLKCVLTLLSVAAVPGCVTCCAGVPWPRKVVNCPVIVLWLDSAGCIASYIPCRIFISSHVAIFPSQSITLGWIIECDTASTAWVEVCMSAHGVSVSDGQYAKNVWYLKVLHSWPDVGVINFQCGLQKLNLELSDCAGSLYSQGLLCLLCVFWVKVHQKYVKEFCSATVTRLRVCDRTVAVQFPVGGTT